MHCSMGHISSFLLLLCFPTAVLSNVSKKQMHGPSFIHEPPEHVLFSNTTGSVISCSGQGTPQPTVSWYRYDGSPAISVAGLRQLRHDGTLVFFPFQASQYRQDTHATVYRCLLSNIVGVIRSRDVHVKAVVFQPFASHVSDHFVIRGNTAVIRCLYPTSVKDYVKITLWMRDDGVTIGSPGLTGEKYIILPTGELLIRNISPADAIRGYKCQLLHQLTSQSIMSSNAGKIIVREPLNPLAPTITEAKTLIRAREGEKVYIPCISQSYPQSTYRWMKRDGVRLLPIQTSSRRILHGNEILVIQQAISDDSGVYICIANNSVGEERTETKLLISKPLNPLAPTITEAKTLIRAREGEKVYIPCISQSYPQSTYRWMKRDGVRLLPIQTSSRRILHGNEILVIQQAISDDSGVYICIANNSVGEERTETKLLISSPLSCRIEPKIQKVDIGKQALLNCKIQGQPVHSINWLKDGFPIILNNRISLISREVIQIYPVQREDKGMYQCFVGNDIETFQSIAEITIGEDAPTLIYTFREQTIQPGTSISLKCSAAGNPLPQVTWLVDNSAIPEAYHIRIGDYVSDERTVNSYVNISSLKIEDGGIYTCIAQNDVGSKLYSSKLNVYGPPFIKPMRNITVLDGQNIQISCPVSGYPIEKIYWERDGRILPHNHRQRSFNNGTLVIQEVQKRNDGGRYTCIAEDNKGRSARRDVTMTIMAPPVLEPFFFPNDLTEGKRASVACVVSAGDLPIQIRWLKDGQSLSKDLHATITMATEFTSLLSVLSVSQHHNGNYTCIASNPAAQTNYTAVMVVRVPPKWSKEPNDKSVVMGQAVLFDCQAQGFPEPVIRWKKSGGDSETDFQVIISSQNIQILENGSLSIKESIKEDEGNYMCQANNDVGSGLGTIVKLNVHVPAHFQKKFHTETVRRGESITLNCEVFGEKPIVITWSRDGHSFNPEFEPRYVSEEQIRTSTSSVIFTIRIPSTSRRDSAVFTCTGENSYGKDDTNFQIVVQGKKHLSICQKIYPPASPALEIVSSTSSSIYLTWKPLNSDDNPISGYIIYHKSEIKEWEEIQLPDDRTSYTFKTLRCGMKYQFYLVAYNNAGRGQPSDVISGRTDGTAPISPDKKSLLTINSTSVMLHLSSWQSGGCPINFFVIQYKPRVQKEWILLSNNVLTEQKVVVITDLMPATWYVLLMTAHNDAGSAEAEFVFATLTITGATVPPLSSQHDKNQFYQQLKIIIPVVCTTIVLVLIATITCVILMRRCQISSAPAVQQEDQRTESEVPKPTDTVPLSVWEKRQARLGHSREQLYFPSPYATSRISMYSADGDPEPAPHSGWRGEHTYDVPFLPRQKVNSLLCISSQPPAKEDQHGIIEGYYVGYKMKEVNELYTYKTSVAAPGNNQECELSNLRRHTKYSIIVQAFNSKGTGPKSEEVIAQTLEYDPPASPALEIVSSTSSSIYLTWKPLNSDDNPISGYIIYHKSEIKEWEEIQLPDDRTSYTFKTLRCGMKYQFYLVAYNNAGRGQPSDVISGRTDGTAPISPDKKSLLTINSTSVMLHLSSWQSGGCPINFFVIQYKPRVQKEWILLSNNVLTEQKVVVITDLMPATWYVLLMTAHNDAGSAEAEFVFATLTITGATVPPLSSQHDKNQFYQQLKIIIPVVCTTIVLVLIATITCVILMRRCQISSAPAVQQEDQRTESEVPKPTDTVPLSVWEKRQARLGHSREQLYFPSPYATSRISMYSADGDPEPAPHSGWRGEHTYDVPFLPRQVTRRTGWNSLDKIRKMNKTVPIYSKVGLNGNFITNLISGKCSIVLNMHLYRLLKHDSVIFSFEIT
ncbi:Down syndrome cell adhesion molecule homolog [Centruroides sculpturatus]|uniref:Down syndrome cell adhesion molecule homolog n=1 Tax=Centruroides sculpturatus TaxID=218467 RepID=UPI000C6D2F68|nr:Down syndrome cell adhesion molecule homolog [Centruroides sculpturatus]